MTATAVYRFYDANDLLLYVGITENVDARFNVHSTTKPWWPDVARHTIEWRPSREEAEAAEVLAIIAERPKWNVRDSPWAPEPEMPPHIRAAMENGGVMAISDARANLTDLIAAVRFLRRCVYLVRRHDPRAAIVPVDVCEAIIAVGGADEAVKILRAHSAA